MESKIKSSLILNITLLRSKKDQKYKKCPKGGWCFNPLCALGCVERY